MVGPSFPLVFHIPLVFSAGEPKEGFAGGTHTPIYQTYNALCCLSGSSLLSQQRYIWFQSDQKDKLRFCRRWNSAFHPVSGLFICSQKFFLPHNKVKCSLSRDKTTICRVAAIFAITIWQKHTWATQGWQRKQSWAHCRRRRAEYVRLKGKQAQHLNT